MFKMNQASLPRNSSMEDIKLTEETCEYIAVVGAGLFYLVIFILMVLCVLRKYCLKDKGCKVLFTLGAAIMLLHIYTNDKFEESQGRKVILGFEIAANATIGVIALLMGLLIFPKRPSLSCGEDCLVPCSYQQHKENKVLKIKELTPMHFVMKVTVIIFVIEIVFLVKTCQENRQDKMLILTRAFVFLFEKALQMVIYWFLCRTRCIMPDHVSQAKFFFKVMSFFNAVIWLDDMVNIQKYLILEDVKESGPPWVNIFGTLYKACIIDYRMLFSLSFLSHALMLSNQEEEQREETRTITRRKNGFVENLLNYLSFGFITGCLLCLLQFSSLINYVKDIDSGVWIHGLTIIAEVFIIICCWKMSINLAKSTSGGNDSCASKRPNCVKIVLCCFGAFGLAYWFYAAVLVASWAISKHGSNDYFSWICAKSFFRFTTAVHLMFVFMQTNVDVIQASTFARKKVNHFLIGCLMLGAFSEFLGAAVDQYVGPIEKRYQKEVTKASFQVLLEIGPALYLAFCVRASLHFFDIQKSMKAKILERPNREEECLIDDVAS